MCPFGGIGHESSFAYLFGKIHHMRSKQKLIIPTKVISITYENDLYAMLTSSMQMAVWRLSSSLATRLILVSILFSSTSKAHG